MEIKIYLVILLTEKKKIKKKNKLKDTKNIMEEAKEKRIR